MTMSYPWLLYSMDWLIWSNLVYGITRSLVWGRGSIKAYQDPCQERAQEHARLFNDENAKKRESNLEPLPNYPAPSKQDWYISFVSCKLRVLLFYTMQSNTSWYPNIKIVWTIPRNLSSCSTWQSRGTQGSPANNVGQIRDKNNHDRCPSLLYYSLQSFLPALAVMRLMTITDPQEMSGFLTQALQPIIFFFYNKITKPFIDLWKRLQSLKGNRA